MRTPEEIRVMIADLVAEEDDRDEIQIAIDTLMWVLGGGEPDGQAQEQPGPRKPLNTFLRELAAEEEGK